MQPYDKSMEPHGAEAVVANLLIQYELGDHPQVANPIWPVFAAFLPENKQAIGVFSTTPVVYDKVTNDVGIPQRKAFQIRVGSYDTELARIKIQEIEQFLSAVSKDVVVVDHDYQYFIHGVQTSGIIYIGESENSQVRSFTLNGTYSTKTIGV